MGRFASRGCPAFSFIEIVLALMILSMLVGITVTTFKDSMDQTQRDVTMQKLQYLADAVQRWKMEQNREYPYRTLRPLEEKYIKHLEADPWGSEYAVDPGRGYAYSFGPNRQDDSGEGDDMRYSFDTDRDPPPGPPSELRAERSGADVVLTWVKPKSNIDGSAVNDLGPYALFMRRSQDSEYRSTSPVVITSSVLTASFTTASIGCVNETVYFVLRAVDQYGHMGPPSNPAGIFVVERTAPVINLVRESKSECHIGETFTITIDVSDGDANLTELILDLGTSGVGPIVWTTNGAGTFLNPKLDNRFHPVITWSYVPLLPTAPFTVTLTAKDGSIPQNTTVKSIALPCQFVNTPPKVTTLSPGVFTITVSANSAWASPGTSGPVEMTYMMEAVDAESNLTELCVSCTYLPGVNPPLPIPGDANAKVSNWTYSLPGVPIAVEQTVGWRFLPRIEQTLSVVAWAKDALNLKSSPKVATLKLYKDQTPPSYLTAWLDTSNMCLTTEPFTRWWINTPTQIEGDLWAWENESPPVTYRMIISTNPPSSVLFKSTAVTRTTSASLWSEFTGTGPKHFTLKHGSTVEGQSLVLPGGTWDSGASYYITVAASNSVGQWTPTSTLPRHQTFKTLQSPFGFDDVPPEITGITIDSLGPVLGTSDVWIADSLAATWTTRDLRQPPNPTLLGSGPKRWQYRILCDPDYKTDAIDPYYLAGWVDTDTPEIKSLPLPKWYGASPTPDAAFTLFMRARDAAGNWSPLTTAGARMDLTTPAPTSVLPRIANTGADGFLHTADTVECVWPGVFTDPESGIQSYEWGVATTANPIMGMPDVVPWQLVPGNQLFGSFSQDNLLVDGSTVYLLVRARNYAKGVSGWVHSTGVGVDVSVYTEVKATPRQGYSPLSVTFTATVTGGTPDYTYTFLFDGTDTYPNRIYTETTSLSSVTTQFTYDEAEFGPGRHSAVVKIKDSFGVSSFKDIHLDLFPSPYVAVLMANGPGSPKLALYRFQPPPISVLSQLFAFDFGAFANVPVAFDVCRSGNFMYILCPDVGLSRLTRWDYRGPHDGATSYWNNTELSWTTAGSPRDLKLAGDGTYVFACGDGPNQDGGNGWWGRVLTNPVGGASYAVVQGNRVGTAYCYAAATWGGGRSSAVIQDGGTLGANDRRIVGVDQGLGDSVLELAKYYSQAPPNDELGGLRAMAVSPDGHWLAATYNVSPISAAPVVHAPGAPEAILCDARLLGTGSGTMQPVTFAQCVDGNISLTNPVWRFDSKYFYAARADGFANAVYFCDASAAVPTLQPVTQLGIALDAGVRYLDLTEDGRYLAAVTSGKLFLGTFSSTVPTQLSWSFSALLPAANGIRVRFMDRPSYGAPMVNAAQILAPLAPALSGLVAPYALNIRLRGANLMPLTVCTGAECTADGLTWGAGDCSVSAASYDSIDVRLQNSHLMSPPPPRVVRLFLQNSVGAANLTTYYDVTY